MLAELCPFVMALAAVERWPNQPYSCVGYEWVCKQRREHLSGCVVSEDGKMKHIVITGANRGIGLELARLYGEKYPVTALCRSSSEELEALPHV